MISTINDANVLLEKLSMKAARLRDPKNLTVDRFMKSEAYWLVIELVEEVFVTRPKKRMAERLEHIKSAQKAKHEMESKVSFMRPKTQEDEDHETMENEIFGNLHQYDS